MTISNFVIEILKDPSIFEQNRLDPVSDHQFFASSSEALVNESSLVTSLNGKWRFHYAKNLEQRPIGFENADYDESAFGFINVPGHFETQGFGIPHYTNRVYPWEGRENVVPGQIPQEYNPVGSYVTYFEIDEKQDNTFICFNGVDSAFALWVNGKYVGYSEDTFTPSHFDLSKVVTAGKNRLCVQVFKYSSGSHLEDQDYWRLSGIFRDVYLYTKPKLHLKDFFLKTVLKDNYTKATVTVEPVFETKLEGTLDICVKDKADNTVYKIQKNIDNSIIEFGLENVDLWSAEHPNLYTIEFTLLQNNTVVEYVKEKFGVREFKLENKTMLINGERIIFNGVNRHEFSAKNGRAITKEEILEDLLIIKRNNINAIRTCHYPNNSYFYRLCDELGFYVIDETNLETHGYWQKLGDECYTENTLPDNHPQWHDNVISRGEAMVCRDKNHACVIIWSCGNESFGGQTLFDLSNYFRNTDPSRLVHYEGLFHDRRFNATSDMESQMYTRVADVIKFLKEHDDKPMIMCEYTHSMGNSNGGMNLYTDLAKEGGLFQGGFIWDFADQAFFAKTENGTDYLAYGGDFGDRPTDYNFAGNGIVFADRSLTPKMAAVKYNYQSFELLVNKDNVVIENFNLFTNLNEYETVLTLSKNGVAVYSKSLGKLDLAPKSKATFSYTLPSVYSDKAGEYTVEISIRLAKDTAYAKAGYEIAFEQYVYKVDSNETSPAVTGKLELCGEPVNYAIVGDNFRVIFNNERGSLVSVVSHDKELIKAPTTLNFWRAPIDNDNGAFIPNKLGMWKIAGQYAKLVKFRASKEDDCIKVFYTHELCTVPVATVDTVYTVKANGNILVNMSYKKVEGLPDMPDFGMLFKLYSSVNKIKYYGLGPCENYCDRTQGSKLGLFESTVKEQYVPYLKPQECGNHSQVRNFDITNELTQGLSFVSAQGNLNVSALENSPFELENALHTYELPNSQTTFVKVSKRPMGVAGDDTWGSHVLDEFANHNEDVDFSFEINIL